MSIGVCINGVFASAYMIDYVLFFALRWTMCLVFHFVRFMVNSFVAIVRPVVVRLVFVHWMIDCSAGNFDNLDQIRIDSPMLNWNCLFFIARMITSIDRQSLSTYLLKFLQ